MINEMENGYITVPLYERSFGTEVTGDFTLPDYQNEIRRILHVTPTVLPPAKYVSDSSVEFNGTVDYQVIYVGGDGGVYSVPLSSDYSFSVPLEKVSSADTGSSTQVLCSVYSENVSTRVSSPRRLNIRCRLRPNVRIYGTVSASSDAFGDADAGSMQRRTCRCESLHCESATSDVISVSCSVPTEHDDIRVCYVDSTVKIDDISSNESGVRCTGEVCIALTCVREESGELLTLEGQAPFEGEVDMEGVSADCEIRVRGTVSETSVSVGETGIECAMGIILEAAAYKNGTVEYTDDVYSTDTECECFTRSVSARELLACVNSNFTLSERIPLASLSVPEGAQIIGAIPNVCMDKCSLVAGKYVFVGNAVFCVIYENDGDVWTCDVSVPVRFECDARGGEPVAFDAAVRADSVRLKVADGNLCVDAEMNIVADCFGENVISCVDRVSLGEAFGDRESEIVVCYPLPDDTVWSIAKRYRVAPCSVCGDPKTDKYILID